MSALFPDTGPEAEQVLIELLRAAPVARKLEMLGQMNAARAYVGARRVASTPSRRHRGATATLSCRPAAWSGIGCPRLWAATSGGT